MILFYSSGCQQPIMCPMRPETCSQRNKGAQAFLSRDSCQSSCAM